MTRMRSTLCDESDASWLRFRVASRRALDPGFRRDDGNWRRAKWTRLAMTREAAVKLASPVARYYFFFGAGGTLPPALRASDSAIATACLRLVTFFPEPPERSVPSFFS